MTDGTLDTTGPKPAVRLERHLPDPPPVVWRALSEREQLKAWFPLGRDPRIGPQEGPPAGYKGGD